MDNLKAIDLKSVGLDFSKWLRQNQIDGLIVIVLAIAITITTFFTAQQIPAPVLTDFYAQDTWFGGDLPTVFGNITNPKAIMVAITNTLYFRCLFFP